MNEKQKSPLLNFTKDKNTLISVILLGVALLAVGYGALISISGTLYQIEDIFSAFRFNFNWIWNSVIRWFWNAFVVVGLWDIAYIALPAGIVLRDTHKKANLIFPVALFLLAGLSFFDMFGSTYSFVFPSFLVGFGNVIDAFVTTAGFVVLGLHYLFKGEKITKLFKWIALGAIAVMHVLDYLIYVLEMIVMNVRFHIPFFTAVIRLFNGSVGYLPLLLVLVAVLFYNPFKEVPGVAEDAPVAESVPEEVAQSAE